MKKNLTLILAAALLVIATSCEKTSLGHTFITTYPTITLLGDNPLIAQLGEEFEDPGFTAVLDGQDWSSNVNVASDVDSSYPGIYSMTYSTVSKEGFPFSVVRDVYVLNPGGIPNIYISRARNASGTRDYKNIPIVITEESEGVYLLEDLLGGYYFAGVYPGYEPTYDFHAEVKFSINEDGSFNILEAGDFFFKSSFDYDNITGGYNAETGVFDYNFDGILVTLTPYEP